jgi:hypothetical protein
MKRIVLFLAGALPHRAVRPCHGFRVGARVPRGVGLCDTSVLGGATSLSMRTHSVALIVVMCGRADVAFGSGGGETSVEPLWVQVVRLSLISSSRDRFVC